jgi:hypothetical protein
MSIEEGHEFTEEGVVRINAQKEIAVLSGP